MDILTLLVLLGAVATVVFALLEKPRLASVAVVATGLVLLVHLFFGPTVNPFEAAGLRIPFWFAVVFWWVAAVPKVMAYAFGQPLAFLAIKRYLRRLR